MTTKTPTTHLTTYHRNPRQGNLDAITDSLTTLGQYRPIVVNTGTHTGRPNEVLAGNHTLLAARRLGWQEIDTVYVDVDDDTAARIVIADNRTSDLATNDDRILAELLADLPDLTGTGYTPYDLDHLADELGEDTALHSADLLAETPDSYREQYAVLVVCSSEAEQQSVFDNLQGQGFNCRVVTT